jgi:hypothetical protein
MELVIIELDKVGSRRCRGILRRVGLLARERLLALRRVVDGVGRAASEEQTIVRPGRRAEMGNSLGDGCGVAGLIEVTHILGFS